MDKSQHSSRRLLWIGVVAVVVVIIAVVAAMVMLFGTKKEPVADKSVTVKSTVVTRDDIRQNLATLGASVKQAKADQDAARAAINDENHIKLGS